MRMSGVIYSACKRQPILQYIRMKLKFKNKAWTCLKTHAQPFHSYYYQYIPVEVWCCLTFFVFVSNTFVSGIIDLIHCWTNANDTSTFVVIVIKYQVWCSSSTKLLEVRLNMCNTLLVQNTHTTDTCKVLYTSINRRRKAKVNNNRKLKFNLAANEDTSSWLSGIRNLRKCKRWCILL